MLHVIDMIHSGHFNVKGSSLPVGLDEAQNEEVEAVLKIQLMEGHVVFATPHRNVC